MKITLIFGLFVCMFALSAISKADDFVLSQVKIDNVRNAKSVFDEAKECLSSATCVSILKAGSVYFGIPAEKVVAAAALLSSSGDEELTETNITLPSGYSYCKSTVHTVSIVTHDGPRGSTLLARADPKGLNIQTWTQRLPPGQGRTWVEADITVIGVRDEVAVANYESGKCFDPKSRVFLYCRGGGCEEPRDTEDSGQAVDSSTRPEAGSRK